MQLNANAKYIFQTINIRNNDFILYWFYLKNTNEKAKSIMRALFLIIDDRINTQYII